MYPSVRNKPLKSDLRDLPSHAVKSRNRYRFGSIVYYQVNSGRLLKRPDVSAFTAYYSPFNFIVRYRDIRRSYFGGMFRRDFLYCDGKYFFGSSYQPVSRVSCSIFLNIIAASCFASSSRDCIRSFFASSLDMPEYPLKYFFLLLFRLSALPFLPCQGTALL